jgi:hypothetical protein
MVHFHHDFALQELKEALLCRRSSAPPGATRKLRRPLAGSPPENQLQRAGPRSRTPARLEAGCGQLW